MLSYSISFGEILSCHLLNFQEFLEVGLNLKEMDNRSKMKDLP